MKIKSLSEQWESFKSAGGQEPEIITSVKLIKQDSQYLAVLTKEITDRDGEMVKVEGMELPKSKKVPLINSHDSRSEITKNVLGSVIRITKSMDDGKPTLLGELVFANTEAGKEAQSLVEDGHVDSVSIGMRVKLYDPMAMTIVESELFEASLVAVPANPDAKISKKVVGESDEDVEKSIAHYKQIKPIWKLILKTFLSDELCEKVGYKKQGDLLVDVQAIYDLVLSKSDSSTTENQEETVVETENQEETIEEATQNQISSKALQELIYQFVSDELS